MIKKLVGLAAIGGFLYAHKRRGGQLTLESFKQTARSLVDDAKARAKELKASAEKKLEEERAAREHEFAPPGFEQTGYGTGFQGDINRR